MVNYFNQEGICPLFKFITLDDPLLVLLSSQFLARAQQPSHPSHQVVNLPPGPRMMKQTLKSKVGHLVEPHLVNDIIPAGALQGVQDAIHSNVVGQARGSLSLNRVLGARAPSINSTEKHLPRQSRTVLSQLCSGHCARLRDFQVRISKADDNLCPSCQTAASSVSHLFNCPAHPNRLTPFDLWRRPWEVAFFLRQQPDFADLPAIRPLPPRQRQRRRPPPEPPPSSP